MAETRTLTGPDLAAGISIAELPENTPVVGHAHGESVVLVRTGAEVRAVGASCTHYGGPLGEGLVVGTTIRCP
jgi:nitrite reductase/ring-hydroxylating ferredoxin subunit